MARKGWLARLFGGGKKQATPKAPPRAAPVAPPVAAVRVHKAAPKARPTAPEPSEFQRMQRRVSRGEVSSSALLPYYYRQSGAKPFRAGLMQLPREDLTAHAHFFRVPVRGRSEEDISRDITHHVGHCKGCRLGTTNPHRMRTREDE